MFTLIGGVFALALLLSEKQWALEKEQKAQIRWEEGEALRDEMVGQHTGEFQKIRRPTRPARKKHRH